MIKNISQGQPISSVKPTEIQQTDGNTLTSGNETKETSTPPQNTPDKMTRVSEHQASGLHRQSQLEKQLPQNQPAKSQQASIQYSNGGRSVTVSTGSGDDNVDISMDKKGHVHVKVNDSDVDLGSREQIKEIKIDTGAGNDVVHNSVDGVDISTGKGNDTVINESNLSHIDTGEGRDNVKSRGSDNTIISGSDGDKIESRGDRNRIQGGGDGGSLTVQGDDNFIKTKGSVTVQIEGSNNKVNK